MIDLLLGETITEITGAQKGSTEIRFKTKSGRKFLMYHQNNCCETVDVDDVVGDVLDLIGYPILKAEESTPSLPGKNYYDSYTWTFYHLATVRGYVDIKWFGSSNGYYSEDVSFEETTTIDA